MLVIIFGLSMITTAIYKSLRPFHCAICSTRFSEKYALKRHVSSFHEENMALLNYCHICFKNFQIETACMFKAILIIAADPERMGLFQCKMCVLVFQKTRPLMVILLMLKFIQLRNHLILFKFDLIITIVC